MTFKLFFFFFSSHLIYRKTESSSSIISTHVRILLSSPFPFLLRVIYRHVHASLLCCCYYCCCYYCCLSPAGALARAIPILYLLLPVCLAGSKEGRRVSAIVSTFLPASRRHPFSLSTIITLSFLLLVSCSFFVFFF